MPIIAAELEMWAANMQKKIDKKSHMKYKHVTNK
jgi:hypothetical protein